MRFRTNISVTQPACQIHASTYPRWLLGLSTLLLGLSNAYGSEAEGTQASTQNSSDFYQQCLLRAALSESGYTTLEQIRQNCKMLTAANLAEIKPLARRRLNELTTQANPFVLTPHKLNYVMFAHYNSGIYQAPFEENSGKSLSFEDNEMQFQLSFKMPLVTQWKVLGKELDVYGAYTNRSF